MPFASFFVFVFVSVYYYYYYYFCRRRQSKIYLCNVALVDPTSSLTTCERIAYLVAVVSGKRSSSCRVRISGVKKFGVVSANVS